MTSRTVEREIHATWDEVSPFATTPAPAQVSHIQIEGPVRYLLLSHECDDASWGIVGAFWLSLDGERGGFIVSPKALWHGSEMVRSFRSAIDRGWTERSIFAYWAGVAGAEGAYMVDPEHVADDLFKVVRLVGAV